MWRVSPCRKLFIWLISRLSYFWKWRVFMLWLFFSSLHISAVCRLCIEHNLSACRAFSCLQSCFCILVDLHTSFCSLAIQHTCFCYLVVIANYTPLVFHYILLSSNMLYGSPCSSLSYVLALFCSMVIVPYVLFIMSLESSFIQLSLQLCCVNKVPISIVSVGLHAYPTVALTSTFCLLYNVS